MVATYSPHCPTTKAMTMTMTSPFSPQNLEMGSPELERDCLRFPSREPGSRPGCLLPCPTNKPAAVQDHHNRYKQGSGAMGQTLYTQYTEKKHPSRKYNRPFSVFENWVGGIG